MKRRRALTVALFVVGFAVVVLLTAVQTAVDEPWVVAVTRIGIGVVSVLVGSGIVWLRTREAPRERDEARHRARGR